jgi:hypothetical protein
LAALLLIIAAAGCAKQQALQQPAAEPTAEGKPAFPEAPAGTAKPPPAPAPATAVVTAPPQAGGFRVQIFVSSTRENALKVAEDARWKFKDQQVFFKELDGAYKVQVGSSLSRPDADALKARAKALGFEGAFVIELQ